MSLQHLHRPFSPSVFGEQLQSLQLHWYLYLQLGLSHISTLQYLSLYLYRIKYPSVLYHPTLWEDKGKS